MDTFNPSEYYEIYVFPSYFKNARNTLDGYLHKLRRFPNTPFFRVKYMSFDGELCFVENIYRESHSGNPNNIFLFIEEQINKGEFVRTNDEEGTINLKGMISRESAEEL